MARTYTFGPLKAEYARRWAAMKIKPGKVAAIDRVARKIITGKEAYQAVERDTGVPWAVVGVLHNREASCDFAGVLHNGEKILSTGRKTRLAPKGRGPFTTWHEAALDAIAIKGWDKSTVWTVEFFLFASEKFNGFGYRMQGVPSAYLWSFSDQYVRGKYVADHKWDPTEVDQQMGVAPLMRRLWELDADARFSPAEAGAPAPDADDHDDDVGADAIDPDDGLTPGEVLALQQRLRDLGYSEVGRVDGKWGPRTVAAVSAFQATSGLPVTGDLDKTTAAALTTAPPRPVGDSRATTTAATLRQHGDQVAKASWWAKAWAWVMGAPAAAVGVMGQTSDATDKLGPVKNFLGDVPGWAWALAVAGVAVALYLTAQRAERAAVDAVRSGRDAGPA